VKPKGNASRAASCFVHKQPRRTRFSPGWREPTVKELEAMAVDYKSGLSLAALSTKWKRWSKAHIQRRLIRHGIKLRSGLRKPSLSPEKLQILKRESRARTPLPLIAAKLGCSVPTVIRFRSKLGLYRPTLVSMLSAADIRRISAAYKAGQSLERIAPQWKLSASTIRHVLCRHGVAIPPARLPCISAKVFAAMHR
jgi:lambda repressor-like predicted transcriptional regulator